MSAYIVDVCRTLREMSFRDTPPTVLKPRHKKKDVQQHILHCTTALEATALSGLIICWVPFRCKNFMDHHLHNGTSSGTENQYDIMHTVLVDTSASKALLHGSHGITQVIHVISRTWLATMTEMVACAEFASRAVDKRASDNKPPHVECCAFTRDTRAKRVARDLQQTQTKCLGRWPLSADLKHTSDGNTPVHLATNASLKHSSDKDSHARAQPCNQRTEEHKCSQNLIHEARVDSMMRFS